MNNNQMNKKFKNFKKGIGIAENKSTKQEGIAGVVYVNHKPLF